MKDSILFWLGLPVAIVIMVVGVVASVFIAALIVRFLDKGTKRRKRSGR